MPAGRGEAQVLSMMASLERNPAKPIWVSGMPTPVMASVPITMVQKVTGSFLRSPP